MIKRSAKVKFNVKRFIRDDSGATAIEYGLIASMIGIAIIAGVQALGTSLSGTFAKVSGNLA
jgi:pilus assembly protein Flp/PilA